MSCVTNHTACSPRANTMVVKTVAATCASNIGQLIPNAPSPVLPEECIGMGFGEAMAINPRCSPTCRATNKPVIAERPRRRDVPTQHTKKVPSASHPHGAAPGRTPPPTMCAPAAKTTAATVTMDARARRSQPRVGELTIGV